MRNLLNHWTTKTALFLGMTVAAAGMASGQASVTAQRGAEIAPFFSTTLLRPDWGQTNNLGYTFGVDYTRFLHSVVQPSLDLRYTGANGKTVNEHSYLGGIKLATTVYGFHPYGVVLGGTGAIKFNYPVATYYGDTSFVYAIGAGMDFRIRQQWKINAEFTQQHWDLDPQIINPVTMSVGVAYSVPFRSNGRTH